MDHLRREFDSKSSTNKKGRSKHGVLKLFLQEVCIPGRTLLQFAVHVCRECLSICVYAFFPFDFEGGMWDLIVLVPDHCLN